MKDHTVLLEESERQMVLLALAKLSLEKPGWLHAIEELGLKMDNRTAQGKPEMLSEFRNIHAEGEAVSETLRRLLRIAVPALAASVKLQSHYASLLNMHDGGERITFSDLTDWIGRLVVTGDLPSTEVAEFYAYIAREQ
jgi:hypothetical protein